MKSILLSKANLDLIALLGHAVKFLDTLWTVKGVDLTNHYITLQNEQGILSTHIDSVEVSK